MTTLVSPYTLTAILLTASNLFMTFAWYGHLKHLQSKPWLHLQRLTAFSQ